MLPKLLVVAFAAVALLPSCVGPRGALDPSALAQSLEEVCALHDAYVQTGLNPDGTPMPALDQEVNLATSAELLATLHVALAEQAKD